MSTGPIAKEYARLSTKRQPYIDRGRKCAKVTLPALFPESGLNETSDLHAPYNGLGARGVNNLSSKLMLACFPSNIPFLRYVIDDFAMVELTQDPKARGEVEKVLSKMERAISSDVDATALRVPIFEAFKHLIVVGNILFYRDPKTGKGRAIPLTSYVCRRSPTGEVMQIIVEERLARIELPQEVLDQIPEEPGEKEDPTEDTEKLYTSIKRERSRWLVTQEVCGVEIASARGGYPLDACPWLPLRMIAVDGEDYGRSYVEEHYGDLNSLEKLTKAIVQFSAASAKIVFGRRPNSTTNLKKLSAAESGDFVDGDLERDITILQLQKQGDFQVTKATADGIEERLAFAFLLNSAIQRNGERVTAEEIRRVAQELDVGLGGIHALLAVELQLPLAQLIQRSKVQARRMPQLPKDFVTPAIVTGIDALGRGNDLENLMTAFNALAAIPNALQRVKGKEAGERVFAAVQVNSDGLFMTDEEVQQEQAAAAAAEMAKAGTPAVAKAMAEGQQPQ